MASNSYFNSSPVPSPSCVPGVDWDSDTPALAPLESCTLPAYAAVRESPHLATFLEDLADIVVREAGHISKGLRNAAGPTVVCTLYQT